MMGDLNSGGAMPSARAASPSDLSPASGSSQSGIPIAETGDWWIGTNEEYMNIDGPVASREKAIEIGRDYMAGDPFYITRARLHQWTAPDATIVMDAWVENHEDLWFEDGFDGFCGYDGLSARECELAAEADLQAVLDAWFDRHKAMCPTPTAFAWMAEGEWIDRPAQGIEAGTDETPQEARPEGQEPGPKDAPKGASHD